MASDIYREVKHHGYLDWFLETLFCVSRTSFPLPLDLKTFFASEHDVNPIMDVWITGLSIVVDSNINQI
jgi:hypothetical protein